MKAGQGRKRGLRKNLEDADLSPDMLSGACSVEEPAKHPNAAGQGAARYSRSWRRLPWIRAPSGFSFLKHF